jgi:hypothetical protein
MIQALACPANPLRPAAMSGGGASPEEALARAVLARDGCAVPAVLVALERQFHATAAVFVKADGGETIRAAGVADGEPAGEGDPPLDEGFIRDVLDAEAPICRACEPEPGGWRAGFRVALDGSVLGAVIVAGRSDPSREHVDRLLSGARSAALTMAVAIGVDGWKQETRGLPWGAVRQGRLIAEGCPPADRAVLEYPLRGHPTAKPANELLLQFPEIVGTGAAIRGLLQSVWVAARSDIPVLIEGESGTGKDLLARAIQHEVDHLDGVLYVDRLSPLKRKLLSRKLKEIASENAPRARE